MPCQNCSQDLVSKDEYCLHCGSKQSAQIIPVYFYTPLGRLVFFDILTLGTYRIYWFYKQWRAVKKAERSRVSPFWRSFFAIFFVHGLFRRIYSAAKLNGYKSDASGSGLATYYVILSVLSKAIPLGAWLITYLLILRIQGVIKYHNTHTEIGYTTRRGWTRGELLLVLVWGLLWIAGSIYSIFTDL